MKRILIFTAACFVACQSFAMLGWTEQRIDTPLAAKEFNRLASQYYDRPTFVNTWLNKKRDYPKEIWVRMDGYGPEQEAFLKLSRKQASGYIELIEKFEEWETIATERGDMFSKKIGKAGGITFEFHSGNTKSHFLYMNHWFTVEAPLVFDRENAGHLKRLLIKFRDGKLEFTDREEVYK